MNITNNIVINSDEYLRPQYKISPFKNVDIFKNKRNAQKENAPNLYFESNYSKYIKNFTPNARKAIGLAIDCIGLTENDSVAILTTTGNFYISGCVTKEIEKKCSWSRIIDRNTKAILVNHEFGFPYEDLLALKKYNIPIIEDCAHSMFSQNLEQSVGTVGDFVIFSLPKMFPTQIGGVLLSRNKIKVPEDTSLNIYLNALLDEYIPKKDKIISLRRYNYGFLKSLFETVGIRTNFILSKMHCPGVFMFTVPENINAQDVKNMYWNNGVESSVFYPENAVYIPANQTLSDDDMSYFFELYYLNFIRIENERT